MAKPAARIAFVQAGLMLGLLAVVGRAAQLQIVQHEHWAAQAEAKRTARDSLPARRGTIYDRHGTPLAVTQEFYRVGVAVDQVKDLPAATRAIAEALGMPASEVRRRITGARRNWAPIGARYTASQVQPLRALRGVHLTTEYRRSYPSRDLARPVIGRLLPDASGGASGLELTLDSLLRGTPGEAVVLRDRGGRRYESPSRRIREPVAGHDVHLTIDADLQEIAERTLDEVLEETGAESGDVVVLDPHNGELLALASRQAAAHDNATARASVFTDPYQPGSTAKLFTAAALVALGRLDTTEAVHGENGRWARPMPRGRPWIITDTEKHDGPLTLRLAIQYSSNIAMVKFSERLTDADQFETLRAFGFGSPTGVEFPSEARGRLAPLGRWDQYTRGSLAMGYEFTATPVQLAAAYGAIANDGVLLTPTLVRQVRSPAGEVRYEHQPEPVRRAVTPEIAALLREYLRDAAGTEGTGSRAQLANYDLLGKTGTARLVRDGRYSGDHTASFAAIFPADDPQFVIVFKTDAPRVGGYYGGLAAAPAVRDILQQALASEGVAIDRRKLTRASASSAETLGGSVAPVRRPAPAAVLPWPVSGQDSAAASEAAVPSIAGATVRDGVRAVHHAGLRVALKGQGSVVRRTDPADGAVLARGDVVTLWTDE